MNLLTEYKPRSGYWADIYRICMKSKNNKTLYLTVKDAWYDKEGNLKRIHEWNYQRIGAMEFDTESKAEEYAKTYFKNFDKWYIETYNQYQGSW